MESGWSSFLSAAEAEGREAALRNYHVTQSPLQIFVALLQQRAAIDVL